MKVGSEQASDNEVLLVSFTAGPRRVVKRTNTQLILSQLILALMFSDWLEILFRKLFFCIYNTVNDCLKKLHKYVLNIQVCKKKRLPK